MWPDNETTDDLIGFQVHADLIRAVVLNPQMLPVTVGLFGDWGSGKTSIMRMLERSLSPEFWEEGSSEALQCENAAVVYINTWQFEGYDDAKSAILSSVLLQLHEHERFGVKIRNKTRQLLEGIDAMRLVRLSFKYGVLPAVAAAATGGATAVPGAVLAALGLSRLLAGTDDSGEDSAAAPALDDAESVWTERREGDSIDVRTFRQEFAALLDDASIDTLVVLIDDLDRCSPDRIVENLEAVKLFLSVDRTAFVIGADRRIVEHAIRSRYVRPVSDPGDHARQALGTRAADRLVRDYLEKLVQVPYSVPRLSAAEIETYMALLFCGMHLDDADTGVCVEAARAMRRTNRYGAFRYGDVRTALSQPVPDLLASHLTLAVATSPLIADGLKGNPRQVKRFLNALMMRKELAKVAGLEDTIETDKLVKLMILEYVEPDLFVDLFNGVDSEDGHVPLLERLESRAKSDEPTAEEDSKGHLPQWTSAWTTRWAKMDPALAGADLRDYFWVSRDRLESTFSGITMVPPIVRTVMADFATGLTPKRNAAVATAQTLDADERAAMYKLLEQEVAARPSDLEPYDALRALAEQEVDGAASTLAAVLMNNPASEMPGTVGAWIITLRRRNPAYREILEPAIEQLSATETVIGRAVATVGGA